MANLVHVSSYKGRESFILDSDSTLLEWLSDNFDRMARSQVNQQVEFVIGDVAPVSSDQHITIRMIKATNPGPSQITREQNQFVWHISLEDSIKFGELVRGLQSFQGAAHQYLEASDPNAPVLVLSKGEYDAGTLKCLNEL